MPLTIFIRTSQIQNDKLIVVLVPFNERLRLLCSKQQLIRERAKHMHEHKQRQEKEYFEIFCVFQCFAPRVFGK